VKRIFKSAPVQALIAWAVARYVMMIAYTTRWRIEGEEHLVSSIAGAPVIVVCWHETLPSTFILWRRAKALGITRPAVVLASQHRDGQVIGEAVKHLGLGLVSGSSSRGGAAGLRALTKALASDMHVALTPDGPRGPRRVCAPGVAQLAALSGAQVMACGAYIKRARTLRSWDQMRLPGPFSRGAFVCAALITVPRDGWEAALPEITRAMNQVMNRAAELA
jgi:lysophospholipid acyltransferase (LPLAT)-like uncharacterized protein